MTTGRKAKPLILHARHGTLRPKRHRARLEGEPKPTVELGRDPPDWFSASQREHWNHALNNSPPGVIMACDRGILGVWCIAADMHSRAIVEQRKWDQTHELPMLGTSSTGRTIVSPYERIIHQTAQTMLRAASQLGFTPAARPKLAGDGTGGPTGLDAFLAELPKPRH
jgi:phage terminase small subunit